MRAEMSTEEGRNSRKVWNHVDELRVERAATGRWVRNGLRVGVGSTASWPAIRAILEAGKARVSKDQLLTQAGVPLLIELGAIHDSESIFSYDRDRRLSGRTFAAGTKILQLDYAFHAQLGGVTDLQVGFEIRHDRGEMTWERAGEGIIRQVPAIDRHTFDDLKVAVTVKSGEFLVIGPSEQADNAYLVGSRFLSGGSTGGRVETLLFLTPMPFQTEEAKKGL